MRCSVRLGSIALGLAVSLSVAAAAWAQPGFGPGGPPQFGFGPGPNMFGGGQVSLFRQYTRLLSMPSVQKALKLTDDQLAKIKEAGDKARPAERELFSGMRGDLSEEERQAKMEEIGKKRQALEDERKAVLERTLLSNQLERLKAIAVQQLGTQALQDEQVQRELNVDGFQAAAIRVVVKRSGAKIRELFVAGADPQTFGTKMDEIRKQTEKQVIGLLSEVQLASFEKMKGEKFAIPPGELRGFGGPGRPGFDRPRGPRPSRGPGGDGGP